jgi:cyclophilin family peptidyl-prolyl cis-trans isomerase/HEAT repeat protein
MVTVVTTSRSGSASVRLLALALSTGASFMAGRCASARPPVVTTPVIGYEQKLVWILQLEDQRILRLPPPPVEPAPPPVQTGKKVKLPPPPPPPPPPPDLTALVKDSEPRIRRRAALAIGRVGLSEGIGTLSTMLGDADPDVRGMAAFALGLIGDASAEAALTPLLADTVPIVRGRAAEALGLVGATGAAPAIGKIAAEYVRSAPVAGMKPDDEAWPAAPEAQALELALFALVRLKAYEPLASAVLDGDRPLCTWWPVAYALQRIEDQRAAPALLQLLQTPGRYTPAFAARGLGRLKQTSAAERLTPFLEAKAKAPLEVVVSAIRALALINVRPTAARLATLASEPATDPNVRLEALTALGEMKATDGLAVAQDLLTDDWPAMRAAALRAAAAMDPEAFTFVLSGLEPDRDWRVRAALAEVLGSLRPEVALERARSMLQDSDKRVIGPVMGALVKLHAPDAADVIIDRLKDPDIVVRASAADNLGALKPQNGAAALREAYTFAQADSAYVARGAILKALAAYGPAEATATIKTALADKDWAIRVKAAELLKTIEPSADVQAAIRPAPGTPVAPYDDAQLTAPVLSPHAFVETARGTIEFELAVLDAPQTTRNFMGLAKKGFFNGLQIHRVVPNFVVQDGDPRGDGEGGPGYTIRDELNERPFLRGTVGMALDWRDTGGSQFFITHSPQPHLDARYTVFGHVVNGMDVVDRIQQGDVIQRVRIWDGKGWQ